MTYSLTAIKSAKGKKKPNSTSQPQPTLLAFKEAVLGQVFLHHARWYNKENTMKSVIGRYYFCGILTCIKQFQYKKIGILQNVVLSNISFES
jgi:hypothetical protein